MIPDFNDKDLKKWLTNKINSHIRKMIKRDNDFDKSQVDNEEIKNKIIEAIKLSNGKDAYTGKDLRWDLINKWNNKITKGKNRSKIKKEFADMPTIDHVFDENDNFKEFKICSWQTNDCKNDLNYNELLEFCGDIIKYSENRG